MTTSTPQPSATELWNIIKKEITGIQLLWETVNGMYFQSLGKDWQALQTDAPLLIHLTQTALMESLLMRVSRMMDPAAKGKNTNLSLKQLAVADASLEADEKEIRTTWDASALKTVRDKYLSHNDLNRSVTVDHSLNIPLDTAEIQALQKLSEGLRVLRRNVQQKLCKSAYVDQGLDAQIQREIETLCNVLNGGNLFFELLPDHEPLQRALESGGK